MFLISRRPRFGTITIELQGAPKYGEQSDWNWGDDAAVRGINSYYGVPFA
nr:hypothetical protein [Bradyrhizobium sp. WSM2254]